MKHQSKIRLTKDEPYWKPFSLAKKDKKFKTSSTLKGESSSHRKKDNTKTKKVQLGWKHFQDSVDKYVLVPLSKGGGCRFVSVHQTMGKFELMKLCKETFLPDGLSHYGKERYMFMDLANFQDEKIEHTIVVNKVELPFNVGNYMEAYKLRNVRLYLRTKNIFSIEDEEEDDLPTYLQDYKKPDVPETQSNTALLIGTSEERKKIAEEQHDEYCLTLNADIAKEEEQQHKKRVQDARMSRVNPEPLTEYVTVKVRHPLLGDVSWKFQVHSLMSSVYDWAGSLNPDPVNFTLMTHLELYFFQVWK